MNIFYLHHSPYLAAKVQYNKHVVKMILESAQMLCTAHHVYGNAEQKLNVPYKQAHLNHPSTIWTRQCRANYRWLYLHMLALGYEYTKRYGKIHASIVKCEKFLMYHLYIYLMVIFVNHHRLCLINIKFQVVVLLHIGIIMKVKNIQLPTKMKC